MKTTKWIWKRNENENDEMQMQMQNEKKKNAKSMLLTRSEYLLARSHMTGTGQ